MTISKNQEFHKKTTRIVSIKLNFIKFLILYKFGLPVKLIHFMDIKLFLFP